MVSIYAVLLFSTAFKDKHIPLLPPWGATVILTNNYLESPYGQPFPMIGGTLLSTIVGISLTKLFMLNPANEEYLWICATLIVAVSSSLMFLTKTIHPAAASTALLCAYNADVRELGWFYLVIQIIFCIVIVGNACFWGNMYAQYPMYWFFPPKLHNSPPLANGTPNHHQSTHHDNHLSPNHEKLPTETRVVRLPSISLNEKDSDFVIGVERKSSVDSQTSEAEANAATRMQNQVASYKVFSGPYIPGRDYDNDEDNEVYELRIEFDDND